jgi:hypothetical protein
MVSPLGDAWEVGSLTASGACRASPSGPHGQAGDLGGPAVQDHSIEFERAPGIGHMPRTGAIWFAVRGLRNHRPLRTPWASTVIPTKGPPIPTKPSELGLPTDRLFVQRVQGLVGPQGAMGNLML